MPPDTVPSWYVLRYHIRRGTENYFTIKLRRFKLLYANSQCKEGDTRWSRSTCYYDAWLRKRVLEPLNCTLYYLPRSPDGYKVCEPDAVVSNYRNLINQSLDLSEVSYSLWLFAALGKLTILVSLGMRERPTRSHTRAA